MSASDDKVRVPIEIDPEDMGELNDLIQRIKDAKSDIRGLEPRTGRGKGDEESRMPYRSTPFEDRGGIFGGETGKEEKFRDKKSAAPFQRGNQFKEMQEELQQIQETQGDMLGSLVNLGFISNVGLSGTSGGKMAKVKGALPKGMQIGKGFMRGGIPGMMGGMGGILGKLGIYGMFAMVAFEIGQQLLQQALRPGGPWDKRFKREMINEDIKMFDLREKEDITQGRRTIRVTTSSNLRGKQAQVRSNLDLIANGERIFDLDGTLMTQSTGVGDV